MLTLHRKSWRWHHDQQIFDNIRTKMASFEQELVFGEFDDLIGEEHTKIYNILHGQVRQTAPKVEFPWDDEVRGAYGDSTIPTKSWADDSGHYGNPMVEDFQRDSTHSPIQFGFSEGELGLPPMPGIGAGPVDYMNPQFQYDCERRQSETSCDDPDDKASQQSKLQASLKQYERRNKKKRPPNYYKQTDMPTEYGFPVGSQNHQMLQGSVMPQNFTVPPPGHPAHYGASPTNTTMVNMASAGGPGAAMVYPNFPPVNAYNVNPQAPTNVIPTVYPDPNVAHSAEQPTPYNQNIAPPHGMVHCPAEATMPQASDTVPHTTPQAGGVPPPSSDELVEIIVDKVHNNNSFHIPPRTETYKNHNHERTSISAISQQANLVNQYATTTSDVVNTASSVPLVSQTTNVQQQPMKDNTGAAATFTQNMANSNQGAMNKSGRVDVSVKDAPFVELSSHKPVEATNTDALSTATTHSQGAEPAQPPAQHNSNPGLQVSRSESISEVNSAIVNKNDIVTPNSTGKSRGDEQESGSHGSEPTGSQPEGPKPQAAPVPKLTSWAGLFKSSSAPVSNVMVPSVPGVMGSNPGETQLDSEREELPPLPVPAAEDSVAKELGERLLKMSISHSTVSLQPRGLVNRANWCYINGTLQALIACPPFYNLLKKLPRYPALSRGPSSTPILDALVEFVHEFQPMNRTIERGQPKGQRDVIPGAPFEPAYVYKMLQTIAVNPHFKLGKQEDAEEFLSCILDGMHEEMSAAVHLNDEHNHTSAESETETEEGYTNGYTDTEGADETQAGDEESWEQVGPKKKSVFTRRANFAKSPIADIFAGLVRSAVYKSNSKETATLQPFFTLQLDIQSEKVWSVQDALEELVSKEQISGYTCSTTNSEVEVSKKLSLEELPPVLVLHLKCFVYNKDGGSQKLMKKVDYKVELEITKDLLSPNARNKLNLQQRSYKLFAVVYHHGKKATGGHYTTNVFHPGVNGWVNSDDSQVKSTHVSQVLKYSPPRVPYLLYYRRLDSH